LALETLAHFANGKLSIHPQFGVSVGLPLITSPGVTSIRGALNLSHHTIKTKATAACTFFFSGDWRIAPPHLRCTEKWIRRSGGNGNPDWHINSDNTFCYVLAPQWADQIKAVEAEHGTKKAITVAAFHAVNNARWLLFHHLLGYRNKLPCWPKDWPQWSHCYQGILEYDQVRKACVDFPEQ